MSIDAPVSEIPPGSGNDTLIDFSEMPVFTVTGTSQVQVSRHYSYPIQNYHHD